MTIDVPAAELYALADALRAQGEEAGEVTGRLSGVPSVGGPLQPVVDAFLDAHRTGATALAGELQWLGSTVAEVADSWLGLDGTMLAPRSRIVPQ
jgi:hypothetical protein